MTQRRLLYTEKEEDRTYGIPLSSILPFHEQSPVRKDVIESVVVLGHSPLGDGRNNMFTSLTPSLSSVTGSRLRPGRRCRTPLLECLLDYCVFPPRRLGLSGVRGPSVRSRERSVTPLSRGSESPFSSFLFVPNPGRSVLVLPLLDHSPWKGRTGRCSRTEVLPRTLESSTPSSASSFVPIFHLVSGTFS